MEGLRHRGLNGNSCRKGDDMEKMKVRYNQNAIDEISRLIQQLNLNTVCKEANCPNMGECYRRRTATFMIMGSRCTRNCRFCNVTCGPAETLDPEEPMHIAQAAGRLGLKHIVITSVTRDDLPDGGAGHFAEVVRTVREKNPDITIEVLIPDFKGSRESLDKVIAAKPEVINHNMETIQRLYEDVRPQADYQRSLEVLSYVKSKAPEILTKTGIMAGLGETEAEVFQLMDDVRAAGCNILTIGQYLQPSPEHIAVKECVSEQQFESYKKVGDEKGFSFVASGALVRSSYRAEEALSHEK